MGTSGNSLQRSEVQRMEAYFGQTTPRSLVLLFLVAAFAMVAVRSLRYQGLQRKVHPSAQAIKLQKFWVSPESWLHVRSKNWEGGLAKGGDQRCLQELRRRWRRIRSQQYLGDRSRDKQLQTPAVSHGLEPGGSCPVPCPYIPSGGYSMFTLQGSPCLTNERFKRSEFSGLLQQLKVGPVWYRRASIRLSSRTSNRPTYSILIVASMDLPSCTSSHPLRYSLSFHIEIDTT